MSARKTSMHKIDVPTDDKVLFADLEKIIKQIYDMLKYHGKKNNWSFRVLMVISRVDGDLGEFKTIGTDKKGRPKKEFVIYECCERIKSLAKKHEHIHIVLEGNPSLTLAKKITSTLNKKHPKKCKSHPCNIGYVDYV